MTLKGNSVTPSLYKQRGKQARDPKLSPLWQTLHYSQLTQPPRRSGGLNTKKRHVGITGAPVSDTLRINVFVHPSPCHSETIKERSSTCSPGSSGVKADDQEWESWTRKHRWEGGKVAQTGWRKVRRLGCAGSHGAAPARGVMWDWRAHPVTFKLRDNGRLQFSFWNNSEGAEIGKRCSCFHCSGGYREPLGVSHTQASWVGITA